MRVGVCERARDIERERGGEWPKHPYADVTVNITSSKKKTLRERKRERERERERN